MKIFKFSLEEIQGFRLIFFSRKQLVGHLDIFFLQAVDDFGSPFLVLLVKIIGDLYKRIRSTAHGRQYDKRWVA